MNYVKAILKYEGIIGAVVGSVSTLVATSLLQSMGRLYFYCENFDDHYFRNTVSGPPAIILSKNLTAEIVSFVSASFNVKFFNNSDIPKVLKSVHIEVVYSGKLVEQPLLCITKSEDLGYNSIEYDVVEFINIPSRKLISFNFQCRIDEVDDFKALIKNGKLFFVAVDHRGKRYKKLIHAYKN